MPMMGRPQQLTVGRIDFSPFSKFTVGFDQIFDHLARTHEQSSSQQNYPPYNIIKLDDNQYALEIAVAGFSLDEIDVGVEGNILVISGTKENKLDEVTYLYKGISNRSFTRSISLGDHIIVKDAVINNGMLTIKLEREIPEAMKPRKIAITGQK